MTVESMAYPPDWSINHLHQVYNRESFMLIPIILLHNAIKYAERNSTIKVDFINAGSFFRIVCTNNGLLVREDELERVFKKGYRGSNKAGIPGHGFGLWLASIIATANLGKITMTTNQQGRDMANRRTGQTVVTVSLLVSDS